MQKQASRNSNVLCNCRTSAVQIVIKVIRSGHTKQLHSPQQPVSSCRGWSRPASCSPAGTASTGRAWMTASEMCTDMQMVLVPFLLNWFIYREYRTQVLRSSQLKCALKWWMEQLVVSACTHSVEDLKFLFSLEDIDLQRWKSRQTGFKLSDYHQNKIKKPLICHTWSLGKLPLVDS